MNHHGCAEVFDRQMKPGSNTMLKNVLVVAIGLLVADAALAQNSLSRKTQSTPAARYEHTQPLGAYALTQSGSLDIVPGNSISCNGGAPAFNHAQNSYYRRLDLDGQFSATGTVSIASVDIGIEQATGASGTQMITVNLYAIPNASALNLANLGAPIASENVNVVDQDGTLFNVPIAATLDGLANDLVVEVFTPDGGTTGNTFFIGSNETASINPAAAPSFIAAPDCGISQPTTTQAIGFPQMNIVMVVNATSLPVSLQGFSID